MGRHLKSLIVLLLMLFLISGCTLGAIKNKSQSADDNKSIPEVKQDFQIKESKLSPKVAAMVNGEEVTAEDFERRVHKTKFVLTAKGVNYEGPGKAKALEQLRLEVIRELVKERVITQEAEKQGLAASEEQGLAAVAEIKKNFDSPDIYRKTMESRGLTEDAMVNYFQFQLTKEALLKKFGDEVKFNEFIEKQVVKAKVEINQPVVKQLIERV